MARWLRSWLPGAAVDVAGEHPGDRFGLPAAGVGSTVGFGRRLAALTVDWLLGYALAVLVSGVDAIGGPSFSWVVMGVWAVLTTVGVALFGATPGKRLLGIRVTSADAAAVIGIPRALVRTVLVALVLPPLVRDGDGRGWHDRVARTVVVRTR
jgi:uncharacterized RDD family membrane protein YckC